MRLYNIYYTCKVALSGLSVLEKEKTLSPEYKLLNWPICKQALESLFDFEFIKSDAEKAYNALSPIDREKVQPIVGSNTCSQFMACYKQVVDKTTAVVDLYESMKDGISQPGIDIKIPPCKDLREYIDILRDIDFIFEQCPYLKRDDEKLQYGGTDVGSDWITFALIGAGAVSGAFCILNNLAALINKAIALKSNKTVYDMQDEMLESMRVKNEVAQETIDAFKKMKSITYKQYVNELKDEIGPLADGEEEGKVEKSLEKLASLIDKGVEIYSSIETPKEIKVLFPFSEKQETLPDNLMKYLEDKVAENNE